MKKENEIVIYKASIIGKIKKFFRKLFQKLKYGENNHNEENIIYNEEKDFKKEIEIKQNEEKLRILKLQEEYKKGLIEEENISKEDYQKLLDLYDEQNKKIKEEIERDKIEVKNMLQQLKNKR